MLSEVMEVEAPSPSQGEQPPSGTVCITNTDGGPALTAYESPEGTVQPEQGTPSAAVPASKAGAAVGKGLPSGWKRRTDFGKFKGYVGPQGRKAQTVPLAWAAHDEMQDGMQAQTQPIEQDGDEDVEPAGAERQKGWLEANHEANHETTMVQAAELGHRDAVAVQAYEAGMADGAEYVQAVESLGLNQQAREEQTGSGSEAEVAEECAQGLPALRDGLPALREGLHLHLSERSVTGYAGVSFATQHPSPVASDNQLARVSALNQPCDWVEAVRVPRPPTPRHAPMMAAAPLPEVVDGLRLHRSHAERSRTGYTGVRDVPARRGQRDKRPRFRADIRIEGGPCYLGTFGTVQEAAVAYASAFEARSELMAGGTGGTDDELEHEHSNAYEYDDDGDDDDDDAETEAEPYEETVVRQDMAEAPFSEIDGLKLYLVTSKDRSTRTGSAAHPPRTNPPTRAHTRHASLYHGATCSPPCCRLHRRPSRAQLSA